MAKVLKSLLRKTLLAGKGNLVSLDDPYSVIASLLRGGKVTGILDAGASNGRVSRKLMKKFPGAHAYAFEPLPMYREDLLRAAAANPLFHAEFFALSDRVGTVDLNVTESPGCTSVYTPSARMKRAYPRETAVTGTQKVPAVTIDGWLARNGNPAIQIMKFDIQGGELAAFQGAVKTLADSTMLVYTEVFFNPLYDGGPTFSRIDQFLRDLGYGLYNIYKPRADASGQLLQANCIFLNEGRPAS